MNKLLINAFFFLILIYLLDPVYVAHRVEIKVICWNTQAKFDNSKQAKMVSHGSETRRRLLVKRMK